MMYKDVPSEYRVRPNGQVPLEKVLWPAEYIEQTVDLPFEGRLFPVPVAYEEVLRQSFGNYMEFPPVEQRVNKHGHTIFEPDIPYKEYVKPPVEPYSDYLAYGEKRLKQELEKEALQTDK